MGTKWRRVRKFGHPDLQGNPCGRSAGSTLRCATPPEQDERHDPGSAGGRVRKSVAKPGTDLIDARAREPRKRLARLAATRTGFETPQDEHVLAAPPRGAGAVASQSSPDSASGSAPVWISVWTPSSARSPRSSPAGPSVSG